MRIVNQSTCRRCEREPCDSLTSRFGYLCPPVPKHGGILCLLKTHWSKHASRWAEAQVAFEILMTHGLQFALLIALCCVLHRYESQDIHRWKFCFFSVLTRYSRGALAEFRLVCILIDPSAGSPTETLLRLFLPLSDQVHSNFAIARQSKEVHRATRNW